jgi:hypothetical protein
MTTAATPWPVRKAASCSAPVPAYGNAADRGNPDCVVAGQVAASWAMFSTRLQRKLACSAPSPYLSNCTHKLQLARRATTLRWAAMVKKKKLEPDWPAWSVVTAFVAVGLLVLIAILELPFI